MPILNDTPERPKRSRHLLAGQQLAARDQPECRGGYSLGCPQPQELVRVEQAIASECTYLGPTCLSTRGGSASGLDRSELLDELRNPGLIVAS